MKPNASNEDMSKDTLASTTSGLDDIKSNLTEDVRLAMEAMQRVARVRRCTPPRKMPQERYYRIA